MKNLNNFIINIPFLENFVKKDSQIININNSNVFANNCRNTNDKFLMLLGMITILLYYQIKEQKIYNCI